jgi:hypothetical protein
MLLTQVDYWERYKNSKRGGSDYNTVHVYIGRKGRNAAIREFIDYAKSISARKSNGCKDYLSVHICEPHIYENGGLAPWADSWNYSCQFDSDSNKSFNETMMEDDAQWIRFTNGKGWK